MRSIPAKLALLTVALSTCVTFAESTPVQPVHTNKTRFRIPYGFDVQELRELQAQEIRLYVSEDRGLHWKHIQSVTPVEGRFDFQAPHDGEYWFAVRTVDGQNQLHPSGNTIEPGLKVVIDTDRPTLEIDLQETEPGKVLLSWRANDLHLNPKRLTLESLHPGAATWQRVNVVPSASGRTWWSVPSGGFVAVRGSIADLASNIAEASQRITVTPIGRHAPSPGVPQFSDPFASAPREGGPRRSRPGDRGPSTGSDPGFKADAGNQPDAYSSSSVPTPGSSRAGFPAIEASNTTDPTRTGGSPAHMQHASGKNDHLPSGVTNNGSNGISEGSMLATSLQNEPPVSSQTRILRSTEFKIGYRVEDVGPSGIGAVELFVTENNGEQWYRYGTDRDRVSPFEVTVPRDGVYGFALRVRSGAGLGDEPPQPGEAPSIVVLVDETPPDVQLAPPEQGQGTALNKVLIRWKVSDARLAAKPIALSYAPQPDGPWEPITGWQPNTGSYLWTVGPGLPTNLYIRLTARDAVGNETRVETPQPVIVDLSRPSAQIVDVKSDISSR